MANKNNKPKGPAKSKLKPKASDSDTTDQPFRLLDLPAEIRNKIYRTALLERWFIWVCYCKEKDSIPPALLQVCHQVRKEASGIYYCENYFGICDPCLPYIQGLWFIERQREKFGKKEGD